MQAYIRLKSCTFYSLCSYKFLKENLKNIKVNTGRKGNASSGLEKGKENIV